MKYIQLAEKLYAANFRLFGVGHFDISIKEAAKILRVLYEDKNITEVYQELYEKRMG